MNIAIIGYGRMGHEIEQILCERGHSVGLIIDAKNSDSLNGENLKNIDVAIEFSTPESAYENIMTCIENGVAVVCGTTAWLDKIDSVRDCCNRNNGAFFYASNYSVGVNLMFKINKMLANLMKPFSEYDVTIHEEHHVKKVDAPSGTAITLAEDILSNSDIKKQWVLGASINPDELNISALRRSVVPGTHSVVWESEVDKIEITHEAKSRRGFALGAVIAAEFINGKRGVFSMEDMLK